MEEINLKEIFKDWEGDENVKLYSPAYGDVKLNTIYKENESLDYPIEVEGEWDCYLLRNDGKIEEGGEVMLFPSKDNRDWSTYKYKKAKMQENFKPFDRVLGKDNEEFDWEIDIFVQFNSKYEYPYECFRKSYKYCIPYEGNENLIKYEY